MVFRRMTEPWRSVHPAGRSSLAEPAGAGDPVSLGDPGLRWIRLLSIPRTRRHFFDAFRNAHVTFHLIRFDFIYNQFVGPL